MGNALDHATILVIDDNPTNLEVLYRTLANQGYDVLVEVDGQNAIEQVQVSPPDLILLDVLMPGIDGFEVCRRLKANAQTQNIPVIFMTALTETRDKVTGFNLGAVDYITKPFQQDEVLARIRLQLQLQLLNQTLEQQNIELKRLNQELEVRVAQRTAALQESTHRWQQSEELLRLTIENAPIGIITTDLEGRLLSVNQSFCAMVGYQAEELLQGAFAKLTHPGDHQIGPSLEQQFLQNQISNLQFEKRYLHQNGATVDAIVRMALVRNPAGQPLCWVAEVEDITERKQAEKKLQEASLRLSSLIQNLQAGILVEDEHRQIVLVNQQLCDLFNIKQPPEKLLGISCGEMAEQFGALFQNPEKFISRVEETLQRRRAIVGEEIVLKDGRIFERDYVPIFADADYQGHLWQYRDICDRKQAEAQLKSSLQEKDLLLKEIHHRVKNNLLVVSSILEFQADYVDDPAILRTFRESQDRIHSMALIHEKLYQSQKLDRINLADYLENLVQRLMSSYHIEGKKIQISFDLEPITLNIETATPCGLIINELIANTFEHAFPVGGDGHIWLSCYKDDNQTITLSIRDDGVGFPGHIDFQNTESLGLQLVCLLTKQLDGSLELERNQGTLFRLTFSELHYRKRL